MGGTRLYRSLPNNQFLAAMGANAPSASNPFATMADLSSFIAPIHVANFSALPDPTTVPNSFYFADASEGTWWLPGSMGGDYYPEGFYYSDGSPTWIYTKNPGNATQATMDAGTNNDQFGTPLTINNLAKWATKADTIHTHSSTDIIDFTESVEDSVGAMVSGNTEDGITVTYDDPTGKLNFTNTDKGSVAISAHESAIDPHPQYTTTSEASAAAPVQSVFSRTGVVVAVSGDYSASQITNIPAGNISAITVQAAINELDSEKQALLVSGTNIKTHKGKSILGSGELYVSTILVQSLADFPAPIANVITLADNVAYQINGSVNIGANRIVLGVSNKIFGFDKSNDKIISTITAAAMITGSNKDVSITFLTLANVGTTSTTFNITGTTNNTQVTDCIFGSCVSLGTISGGNVVILNNNFITGCTGGLTVSGTINEVVLADNLWVDNSSTITCITLTSGTYIEAKVSRNIFKLTSGQTALLLADAVVATNAVVENCDFSGAGTYISGVNFTSPVWLLRSNRGTGLLNTIIYQPRAIERGFFSSRATNGTFSANGMAMTLTANANTSNNDNTTNYTQITTPNLLGGLAAIHSTVFTELRPDYSPIISFVIKTDTSLTNSRIWAGFFTTNLTNADNQGGQSIAFRYSSAAGDTGWRAIVDNGAQTISANIGTVAVSTQYKLEIQVDFANSKCHFRVNGGAWTTVSVMLASGTTLGFSCGVLSTILTTRNLNISRLDGHNN